MRAIDYFPQGILRVLYSLTHVMVNSKLTGVAYFIKMTRTGYMQTCRNPMGLDNAKPLGLLAEYARLEARSLSLCRQ